jgi:1,2-phenylacetyl-CoA epoxidase catalytic subunit
MKTPFTTTAASNAAVVVSNAAKPLLLSMLRSQSYRELAAVQMLQEALQFVPEAMRERIVHQQDEERAHLEAALKLWHAITGEPPEVLLEQARARMVRKPLPAMRSALDVAMAQFVFDRAGYFQLREYVGGSCEAYSKIATAIVAEEEEHQEDGAASLIPLAIAEPRLAQETFELWLHTSLLSFGRPDSEGDRLAVTLGLKRRQAALVMQDFIDSLRPTLAQAGLRFPSMESLKLDLPAALELNGSTM